MHYSGSASSSALLGTIKHLEGTMQFPNMAHSLHNTVFKYNTNAESSCWKCEMYNY